MMKKFLFLFLLAGVLSLSVHAQQWVNFSSSEPRAPECNVFTSNIQSVSFEVTIPGIHVQDTIVNGRAFTRLFLSSGEAINLFFSTPLIPRQRGRLIYY
jgi:hypothetical protein